MNYRGNKSGGYGRKPKEVFQVIKQDKGPGPGKSVEGYIIMVRNLHPETQEEQLYDILGSLSNTKNFSFGFDGRTGFCSGYCFIQYEKYERAKKALDLLNDKEFLGKKLEGKKGLYGSNRNS